MAISKKTALDVLGWFKDELDDSIDTKRATVTGGGDKNVIETVKVNDSALPVSNKAVNINLSAYAKTSDLSSYATTADVNQKLATITSGGGGGDINVIETVKVNNSALTVSNKAVNIDLSSYAKTADVSLKPASAYTLGGIKVGSGLAITNDGTLYVTISGGSSDTTSGGGTDTISGGGTDTMGAGEYSSIQSAVVSYIPCATDPPVDERKPANLTSSSGNNVTKVTNVKLADSTYSTLYRNAVKTLYGIAYTAQPGTTGTLRLYFDSSSTVPMVPGGGNITGITNITKYPPYASANRTEGANDCWFYFPNSAITAASIQGSPIEIVPNVFITPLGKLLLRIGYSPIDGLQIVGASADSVSYDAAVYANRAHHLVMTYVYANGIATTRLALDGVFILSSTGYRGMIFTHNVPFDFTEYAAFNKIRWFNSCPWTTDFQDRLPIPDNYIY